MPSYVSSNPKPRLAFLLGSGISIPAGLPGVDDITNEVLCGQGWIRKKDSNYYYDPPDQTEPTIGGYPTGVEDVLRVQYFLRLLKPEIDCYYAVIPSRFANYEDLYYFCEQIHDAMMFEYDNPAIQPLLYKIHPAVQPIIAGDYINQRQRWKFHKLAMESCNFIKDVVWHKLKTMPERLNHLQPLRDACQDESFSEVDFFTLNHDTLLEKYFDERDQKFNDGFGEAINGVRYWDENILASSKNRVRLIKLHGSINWFRFKEDNGSFSGVGNIPLDGDFWHQKSPNGELMKPPDGRPLFLAGTFNKIFRYTEGIFADLFCLFRETLKQTDHLIVCGYGFSDKGINNQIAEWISAKADRRMLIVHPNPEKLKQTARGAITRYWGWYRFIEKKIDDESISWEEIKDKIVPPSATG